MRFLFLLILGFLSSANATLNEVDFQRFPGKSIFVNSGFELGKATLTASGGTLAVVTSGTNLLTGKSSITWDSNGAAQTVTSDSITVPYALRGSNGILTCRIKTPSGTATHLLEVLDSGANVIGSVTVSSSTDAPRSSINFMFASANVSVTWRLKSVNADEPLIAVDNCFLGSADVFNLFLNKPQDVFSAAISSADAVSAENVDWINGACTDATTGEQTCTFKSGFFSATPNCTVQSTTFSRFCNVEAVSSTAITTKCSTAGGAAADEATYLTCQKSGVDAIQTAYTPDQLANSWSGYHDSTCSHARTNTAYGDVATDASCALVERTNRNFGTVTGSNSLPSITFTPKRAGRYYVCALPVIQSNNLNSAARLWDGTTVIAEADTSTSANNRLTTTLCGIYNATSTSAVTLTVQVKSASGTITIAALTSTVAVEWSIFSLDQSFPMPAVLNNVESSTPAGVRLVSAFIDMPGTPAVTRQDGNWISSLTDNATGDVTINIVAGTFSAAPNCVCTVSHTGNNSCLQDNTTAVSATAVRMQVFIATTGASDDNDIFVMCMGPK